MATASSDRIFDEGMYQKQQAAAEEWRKTHKDPRHKYFATYEFMGRKRTEEVWAMNSEDAKEHVTDEWSKVGVILQDVVITDCVENDTTAGSLHQDTSEK